MIRRCLTINFNEYDKEIYDFIKSKNNASAFIRHLVSLYMNDKLEKVSLAISEASQENKKEEVYSNHIEKEETPLNEDKFKNLNYDED